MNVLNVLCAQLTRDLFAIAKFLFHTPTFDAKQYKTLTKRMSLDRGRQMTGHRLSLYYSQYY